MTTAIELPQDTIERLARLGIRPIHNFKVVKRVEPAQPVKPPCPDCNDTGFYVNDVPHGHDLFGKSVRCNCNLVDRSGQYLHLSGLNNDERAYGLNYQPTATNYPKAVHAGWQIVESGKGMLVLCGGFGTGKSGVLKAIVATACKYGKQAHYCTAKKMMDEIKASFDRGFEQTTEQIINRYINYPILCVDELTKANLTGYTLETYHRIFDERYRHIQNRATAFATNVMPKKGADGKFRFLGQVNPALGYLDDRFKDAERVVMNGESLRGKVR